MSLGAATRVFGPLVARAYASTAILIGGFYVRLTDTEDPWIAEARTWDRDDLPTETCALARDGLANASWPADPPMRAIAAGTQSISTVGGAGGGGGGGALRIASQTCDTTERKSCPTARHVVEGAVAYTLPDDARFIVKGTGNDGKVYRVRGSTVELYAETGQLLVGALVLGEGGECLRDHRLRGHVALDPCSIRTARQSASRASATIMGNAVETGHALPRADEAISPPPPRSGARASPSPRLAARLRRALPHSWTLIILATAFSSA